MSMKYDVLWKSNIFRVEELKDRLKANDQVVSGTKGDLQKRIAECFINGCLPRCPKCNGGRLKLDKKNHYFCPGSYDDDDFVACCKDFKIDSKFSF